MYTKIYKEFVKLTKPFTIKLLKQFQVQNLDLSKPEAIKLSVWNRGLWRDYVAKRGVSSVISAQAGQSLNSSIFFLAQNQSNSRFEL